MSALLRSKDDIRKAIGLAPAPEKRPAAELGGALRQLLEVEQQEMLRGLREEILSSLQQAVEAINAAGDLSAARDKSASELKKVIASAADGVDKSVGKATEKLIGQLEKAVLAALREHAADVVHAVVELRKEVLAKIEVKPGKPTSWSMEFDRGTDNKIKTPVTFKAT